MRTWNRRERKGWEHTHTLIFKINEERAISCDLAARSCLARDQTREDGCIRAKGGEGETELTGSREREAWLIVHTRTEEKGGGK